MFIARRQEDPFANIAQSRAIPGPDRDELDQRKSGFFWRERDRFRATRSADLMALPASRNSNQISNLK
jgi:hypothetical protein